MIVFPVTIVNIKGYVFNMFEKIRLAPPRSEEGVSLNNASKQTPTLVLQWSSLYIRKHSC